MKMIRNNNPRRGGRACRGAVVRCSNSGPTSRASNEQPAKSPSIMKRAPGGPIAAHRRPHHQNTASFGHHVAAVRKRTRMLGAGQQRRTDNEAGLSAQITF